MRYLIQAAIAAFAVTAGLSAAAPSPAAAQPVPMACSSGAGQQLVRNGIPYVRQCLRYRPDGECARFAATVVRCGGGGVGNR